MTDKRQDVRTKTIELFDDGRLATAAIGVAEATDGLSRTERLAVLLFTLLPTLANVEREAQDDVYAMVTGVIESEQLGAGVWLHLVRKWGIGITTTPRRPS
jgi:hypothetical protein